MVLSARALPAGSRADSLQRLLSASRPDTSRVQLLIEMAWERTDDNPLVGVEYGQRGLRLARRLQYPVGECRALLMLGWAFMRTGNYTTAIQTQVQARRLAESIGYAGGIIHADNALGYAHLEQGSQRLSLRYFRRAIALAEKQHNVVLLTPILGNIGRAHLELGQPDSAWYFTWRGYQLDLQQHDMHSEIGDLSILGDIAARRQQPNQAQYFYQQTIVRAVGMPVSYATSRAYLGLARLARAQQQPAVALRYAQQALAAGQAGSYAKGVFEASDYLADLYATQGNSTDAYRFLRAAAATRDSLFSRARMSQVQALSFSEELHQQELAEQGERAAAQRRQNMLLLALAGLVGTAGFGYLLISRRHLRREVEFVQERQRLERRYSEDILDAEQKERRRVGADLHDSVGQLLSAAKMTLSALQHQLRLTEIAHKDLFANTLEMLDEAVREVRSISHKLVPNALTRHGLAKAVGSLLGRLTLAPSCLQARLEVAGLEEQRLDSTLENILFRMVQELVHNVTKHAQASEITVQLLATPQQVRIVVADNGQGFRQQQSPVAAGIGLRNVESRVAYLNGQLQITSAPGQGTSVVLDIPLRPVPMPAAASSRA
ncbi:sensor histidine kinase [Hymenobacter swuensis]|uniref:Oxygen sensor histidine kinase NreB n=1 Tax=Hymenobacter swuensis DY53 TaxID=1227739 RepID=W8F299_9BACT|nr:sensor histidine kinase [Hymenobacter swuensis]AHJ96721.1 histidine kinase [Hymenobacter swuensis DY53]